MIEVRIVLRDENERQAFNKFWSVVESYRASESIPDATGSTEAPESAPPPANAAPAPRATPTTDPAVIAEITPSGVKVTDKRSSAAPAVTVEDLEKKFRDYATNHGLEKARELVNDFGIKYFKDLPKEKYADFLKRLNEPVVVA